MASPEGSGSRNPEIRVRKGNRFSPQNEDDPSLSEDGLFEVLANRRRRQVIEYLRKTDGTTTVSELAEYIASEETDTPINQLSSYDRKRVYISLYQNHLPVMDNANVVDYEEHRKTVQLKETVTELEPYLTDATHPENRGLATTALAVAASVLLGAFQIGPFAIAPISAWVVVGTAGLVGVNSLKIVTLSVG